MNFMGDLFTFGSLHTFSSLSFGVESCGFAVPAFFLSEKSIFYGLQSVSCGVLATQL